MNILNKSTMVALCFLMLAGVTGCGKSRPSTFYLLSSLPETEPVTTRPVTQLKLSIGPVRLPEYLDRTQLSARTEKNELSIMEYSRWGESLKDNFQRVLLVNLSVLLETPHVYEYDTRDIEETDYQLIVDVHRFDVSNEGRAELIVFWSINDGRNNQLQRKKSSLHTESPSLESGHIVKALNQLLTDFSKEVAGVIHLME